MASLKEVRLRIATVKSTQQITNAMKMVSASKLRKAQNAILTLRPYASKLREIMLSLSAGLDGTAGNKYAVERKPGKVLLIAIASNRGLCGGFNSGTIKKVNELVTGKYSEQFRKGNVDILCIGKKLQDYFGRRSYKLLPNRNDLLDTLTFQNTSRLAEELMEAFTSKTYDRIELIYNQFKNAAVQRLTVEQYLPILPPAEQSQGEAKGSAPYIFEPESSRIVEQLIPKTLRIQLYKAFLDSNASEQGARMTAMHKATDNATELLKDLRLTYNKARQDAITKELLEIVSGAEALKG